MPVLNPNALITERVCALRKAHTDSGIKCGADALKNERCDAGLHS